MCAKRSFRRRPFIFLFMTAVQGLTVNKTITAHSSCCDYGASKSVESHVGAHV